MAKPNPFAKKPGKDPASPSMKVPAKKPTASDQPPIALGGINMPDAMPGSNVPPAPVIQPPPPGSKKPVAKKK